MSVNINIEPNNELNSLMYQCWLQGLRMECIVPVNDTLGNIKDILYVSKEKK